MHRLLWHAADLRPDHLTSLFIEAFVDMRSSIVVQDEEGCYLCVTGLPDGWSLGESDPPTDRTIFGEDIAFRLSEAKAAALLTGGPAQIELAFGDDRHFEFRILPLRSERHPTQFVITIIDRTSERRGERGLRQLLREVSHRSKNLLAIIQALATQTSRNAHSVGSFVEKFKGRLYSIAGSQDLITDSGWRGARIGELLREQAATYLPFRNGRIQFSGDNLMLPPNAATHVGLAFHELIANAVEHGTFIRRNETILVTCLLRLVEDRPFVDITWVEPYEPDPPPANTDGPAVVRRFGSALLERLVPMAVSGTGVLEMGEDAIRYRLEFPLVETPPSG